MTLLEIALAGLTAEWTVPKPGDPGHHAAALHCFLNNLALKLQTLSAAMDVAEDEPGGLANCQIQDRILAAAAKLRAADSLFAQHLVEVPA